jgi:hypothetical protein
MKPIHRFIILGFAALSLGTFAFAIIQLTGVGRPASPAPSTNSVSQPAPP